MNIGSAMNLMSQGKQAWATFKQNHPEFPKFLNYVKNKGVPEGTVISIDVKYPEPDGQNVHSEIKVKASDVQLLKMLEGLMN